MTVSQSIVVGNSVLLIAMIGARLRPRGAARGHMPTPTTRAHSWLRLAAAMAVALASIPLGVVVAIFPAMLRRLSRIQRAARQARQVSAGFPDALDLLVLSIRAGYLPAQAIGEITPYIPAALRPGFGAVDQALQRGDRFADALGQLRALLGPVAQPLVDSLSAADRYGLPLAPVLERLSFEARQQRRRDTDAAARELPVRLAMPLVLCTLPSFVLLAIVPLLLGALSSLNI